MGKFKTYYFVIEQIRWIAVFGLGLICSWLFYRFSIQRGQSFDAALLGLLTLSILLFSVAILRPDTIKYGSVELSKMKREVEHLNHDAELKLRLVSELTAMLVWNEGRWGVGTGAQEEVATRMLKDIYGDNALNIRHALQHKGIFKTPDEVLKKIPKKDFPQDVSSPLFSYFSVND